MIIGNYNENSARNATYVEFESNNITFYYSYNTVIGVQYLVRDKGWTTIVRENDWSNTTGKHMNWIPRTPERKDRMESDEFEKLIDALCIENGVELPEINLY